MALSRKSKIEVGLAAFILAPTTALGAVAVSGEQPVHNKLGLSDVEPVESLVLLDISPHKQLILGGGGPKVLTTKLEFGEDTMFTEQFASVSFSNPHCVRAIGKASTGNIVVDLTYKTERLSQEDDSSTIHIGRSREHTVNDVGLNFPCDPKADDAALASITHLSYFGEDYPVTD